MAENNFPKYSDFLTVKECEAETDKEEFIFLPSEPENNVVFGRYKNRLDMLEYDKRLPVRLSVYKLLQEAGRKLQEVKPNYVLWVVYGFRELRIQRKYFEALLEKVQDQFDDELEMYDYIHDRVAVPSIAGHTTGGAVDLGIYDMATGDMVDFGAEIQDWTTTKCYFISDEISDEAKANRELLRSLMLGVGFAPFDGEWWHYCYGDKEWAFYYGKDRPLYGQREAFADLALVGE